MTIEGMHLLFENKYQKKAQNRARGLSDDEIDLLLNDAQDVVVDHIWNGDVSRVRDHNKLKSSDINTLLDSKVFTPSELDNISKIPMPANCKQITQITSNVKYLERNLVCDTSGSDIVKYSKYFTCGIDLNQISTLDGLVSLIINDEPIAYKEVSKSTEVDTFIEWLIFIITTKTKYSCYFEFFNGDYKYDTLILFTTDNTLATDDPNFEKAGDIPGTPDALFDGFDVSLAVSDTMVKSNFKSTTTSRLSLSELSGYSENRIYSNITSTLFTDQTNPFKKSGVRSILTAIGNGVIELDNGKDMKIDSVIVDFIKRPWRVSKMFNIDCELPPTVHGRIVDIAVERVLQSVGSQRYQSKTMDNKLNK